LYSRSAVKILRDWFYTIKKRLLYGNLFNL
jgi:hypothetical protein